MIVALDQREPLVLEASGMDRYSDDELHQLTVSQGILVPVGTFTDKVDYSVVDPVIGLINRLQNAGDMNDISVQIHDAGSLPPEISLEADQTVAGGLIAYFRKRADK